MGQTSEIEKCIQQVIARYLQDLGGETPHALHKMVLCSAEKALIQVILDHTEGNQTIASKILGINRNTLSNKIKKYNK